MNAALVLALLGLAMPAPGGAAAQHPTYIPPDTLQMIARELAGTRRSDAARAAIRHRAGLDAGPMGADSAWVNAADLVVRAVLDGSSLADSSLLKLARTTTDVRRSLNGPASSELAMSLASRGRVLARLRMRSQAVATLDSALAIAVRVRPPARVDSSLIKLALGSTLTDFGDLTRAEGLLREALDEFEHRPDPPAYEVGNTLFALLVLCRTQGRFDEARTYGQRCLTARERAEGDSSLVVAQTLTAIGNIDYNEGRYAEAMPYYERALVIRTRKLGRMQDDVALTLNNLGNTAKALGDFAAAFGYHREALAIRRALFPDTHPSVIQSLRNLGLVYVDVGDFAHVRTIVDTLLALQDSVYADPISLAESQGLNATATLCRVAGEHATARALMERVLEARERILGPRHREVATALRNLAATLADALDLAPALDMDRRAVDILEHLPGTPEPELVYTLHDLGTIYGDLGQYEEAAGVFRHALQVAEQAHPDSSELVSCLADLGRCESHLARFASAQAMLERALAIQERLMPDSSNIVSLWSAFGDNAMRQRRESAAIEYFERALRSACASMDPGDVHVAQVQLELGHALAVTGHAAAAADSLCRALDTFQRYVRKTIRYCPESQALRIAGLLDGPLDLLLAIAMDDSLGSASLRGLAFDRLIADRALVLDELALRHAAVETGDATVAGLRRRDESLRQQVANLTVTGPGDVAPEVHRSTLDSLVRELDRNERLLAARGARRHDEIGPIRWRDLRAALRPDEALVAFRSYPRGLQRQRGVAFRDADTARFMAAFVIRSQGDPTVLTLGPESLLVLKATQWRAAIARRAFGPAAAPTEAEHALSRVLLGPLPPLLQGVRRLYVVPDGVLHLVNLAALPLEDAHYWIESGPVVQVLGAERDLLRAKPARPPVAGLLAFGGVDFDASSPGAGSDDALSSARNAMTRSAFNGARSRCAGFDSLHFAPLPESGREATRIATIWAAPSAPDHGNAVVLTGQEASESAVKLRAPGRRVLHLATHGFFVSDRCGESPTTGANREPGFVENPLLQCGLALAGANARAHRPTDGEDGILTAEEIAAMPLAGLETVVLSSCQSGVGTIVDGEGVFGLQRAFRIAGASIVVMSLWDVEDTLARRWMDDFYESRFRRNLDAADAARRASLAQLSALRAGGGSDSPFLWGAFVASGN